MGLELRLGLYEPEAFGLPAPKSIGIPSGMPPPLRSEVDEGDARGMGSGSCDSGPAISCSASKELRLERRVDVLADRSMGDEGGDGMRSGGYGRGPLRSSDSSLLYCACC